MGSMNNLKRAEELEKAIVNTLIYYDVLGGYPLTAFEVYKYLTDCQNILARNIGFDEILKILDSSSLIKQNNGFYFCDNSKSTAKDRIERQKIADRKWQKLRKIVKWLPITPFIRAIAISGSLSINNTKDESDLDLFIVAQYGRIWTVRAFLSGLIQVMGCRRHHHKIKDRICLNWFTTSQYPALQLRNLSRAHFCAQLMPIWGTEELNNFFNANQWVSQWLPNFYRIGNRNAHLKTIKNRYPNDISNFLEFISNNKIGDLIDQKLANLQKKKIIRKVNPAFLSFNLEDMRKNKQAHLCLSDQTLVFHYPISKNLELQRDFYKRVVDKLWIKGD